jgi:GTPase SAR1 family protein
VANHPQNGLLTDGRPSDLSVIPWKTEGFELDFRDHAAGFKLVIIEDSCVGRTFILARASTSGYHACVTSTLATICDSKPVCMQGSDVWLVFRDTAGQTRFRGITPMCERSPAAIIIYSIPQRPSFDSVVR